MILDNLLNPHAIRKAAPKPPRQQHTSGPNGEPPSTSWSGDGVRREQVKAAVTAEEKALFEQLAETRSTTLSEMIRAFLLRESQAAKLI